MPKLLDTISQKLVNRYELLYEWNMYRSIEFRTYHLSETTEQNPMVT